MRSGRAIADRSGPLQQELSRSLKTEIRRWSCKCCSASRSQALPAGISTALIIKGAGIDMARGSYGVDAFQAIQLALSTLGVELEVINKDLGGKLRWECDDNGGLGFPGFVAFP